MNNYVINNIETPSYTKINNAISSNSILFEYMKSCNNSNVKWGSNKPIDEVTYPNNLETKYDISCNNLWNNNTKRKIIVNAKYKY